jgi:hypothetical protein
MKLSARAPVRGNEPMSARFERRKLLRQLKKRLDKLKKRRSNASIQSEE